MKTEIAFDKEKLKKFILKEYGIKIRSMNSVLGGVSYCYILNTDDGKYFLKIHPDSRLGKAISKKLNLSLKVTFELFSKAGIKNISHPIPTKNNKLKSRFGKFTISIYNFFEGRTREDWDINKRQLENLAILLAKIHKATDKIDLKTKIFGEDIEYSKDLMKCLNDLEKGFEDKYKGEISFLVLPFRKRILNLFGNVKRLNKQINKERPKLVICHRDPLPFNLITKKDEVFLIDWDAVDLAPKEQDIWFYLEEKIFLKAYEEEFGKFKLNRYIVLFYLQDRILEDLTDSMFTILYENINEKQKKEEIKRIKVFLEDIENLDKKIKKIRQIIKRWNKR